MHRLYIDPMKENVWGSPSKELDDILGNVLGF